MCIKVLIANESPIYSFKAVYSFYDYGPCVQMLPCTMVIITEFSFNWLNPDLLSKSKSSFCKCFNSNSFNSKQFVFEIYFCEDFYSLTVHTSEMMFTHLRH